MRHLHAGEDRSLSLGELIEAELQLAADRAAPAHAQRRAMRRDAEIARRLDAPRLGNAALVRRWT